MKKIGPAIIIAVIAVQASLTFGCLVSGHGENEQSEQRDVHLAAMLNLWFGFDLETGESVGGIKSSHWNLDVGSFASRVGVTDEPEYGFYSSDDPTIIAKQLADMELAGIDTILASWHGTGDRDFDDVTDDFEMEAINRALLVLMDYIATNRAPFKVAVLVEPFMQEPSDITPGEKQIVLDYLWENIYQPYNPFMFQKENKPLVVTWGPLDLKEPGDSRFTVKSWGSTKDPNWKRTTNQDWNWYPDVALLSDMISDDGTFVVFPRFDEYWMHIMGRDFPYPYRSVDPLLDQGVYEQTWQVAVENRENIDLIVVYSWNEHEEHSAIEPDLEQSPVSYGRTLLNKTASYHRQFLAGQDIDLDPSLWNQPGDLKAFVGTLSAKELGLTTGMSVNHFLGERLKEAQDLIESVLGRTYPASEVPPGVSNVHLRLASNIYNYILMNKRNPVAQVGDFDFEMRDSLVFTDALKRDLSGYRRNHGLKVLFP